MTDHKGAQVVTCATLDGQRFSSQDAETAYEAAMYPTTTAGTTRDGFLRQMIWLA